MKPRLTLYYREGCHLCEAFVDELQLLQQHCHLEYDSVDVDSSAELTEKYGLRVPLLTHGDDIICEFFLDPHLLHKYVR